MSEITFSQEERDALVHRLQLYFQEEHEWKLGQFDAGFLLDFISEELGAVYYNRGLYDARALFESRVEAIGDAIVELEKPVDLI